MASTNQPLNRSWGGKSLRGRGGMASALPATSRTINTDGVPRVAGVVVEAAKPLLSHSLSLRGQQSALSKSLQLNELPLRRKKTRRFMNRSLARQNFMAAAALTEKMDERTARKDGLSPLRRFRRAGRLVKLLVHVSNVCRDLLVYAIKDEQWYEFCEKFLKESADGGTPIDKKIFLTKFKNPVTKEYEELEFDASIFKKGSRTGIELTKEIKDILLKRPGTRTQREVEETVKCIKKLSSEFKKYSFNQQKLMAQAAMYDRYFQERVILREGLPPDGIYFVLNGTLMESGTKMKAPKIIAPGDKFGEDDLKVGMTRQSNVVTKSAVDLLYLHKQDYIEIFELTVDLQEDESNIFRVCNDELFKYYPIKELIRNPARWQVLKFKYGRLIARDSCETEFIYIMRSGEARVLKILETKTINIRDRRKRLQAELELNDPYANRKKLLNFVSGNDLRSAKYAFNSSSAKITSERSVSVTERIKIISTPRTDGQGARRFSNPFIEVDEVSEYDSEAEDILEKENQAILPRIPRSTRALSCKPKPVSLKLKDTGKPRPHTTRHPPKSHTANKQQKVTEIYQPEMDMYHERKHSIEKVVPKFVQVDFLQTGSTYGMRSLLPEGQRGEPVALVSAGCEVIQINRKFFAKALDDNMLSIIALGAKAYPNEEELLKRLDVTLQWQEYCAEVMCEYLDTRHPPLLRGEMPPLRPTVRPLNQDKAEVPEKHKDGTREQGKGKKETSLEIGTENSRPSVKLLEP